jgi:hypothetical protein
MKAGDVAETALMVAAVAGRTEVVRWLLSAGATIPVGMEKDELFADLTKYGEHEIIELITIAGRTKDCS